MRFYDCLNGNTPCRLWVELVLLKRREIKPRNFLLAAFLVIESRDVDTVVVA